MKTKKIALSTLFIAVAVMMSVSMFAQNGQGRGNRNGNFEGEGRNFQNQQYHGNFIESLDLSDEQQQQIETMRTAHMEKMLPMQNELKEKKAHLNTLSTAKVADTKAINSTIDEIGALKVKMMKERESHQQDIRKVLNDEQRIKFDMHRAHKGGKGKGQGHRHGNCRGNGF